MVFAAARIVKLVPPVINAETILKKTFCIRPMRSDAFNISCVNRGEQWVVNCYGHGGSGWTTVFGSVARAIQLMEGADCKGKPIRIIGSGCMGLTAAIELSRLGYQVKGIYTKERHDICSWRAAGYFALVSLKTSPEEQEVLNEIGVQTFSVYQKIHEGKHPYLTSDTVRYLPVFCSQDTDAGVEGLEARGLIPPKEEVILDFGTGVLHDQYLKYFTYFMDTTKLMKQLTAEVENRQIQIELKDVLSFDEIEEAVIFNCSGLGGMELNSDEKMVPVRGHLVFLNAEAGSDHMDYMIYTKVIQEGREEYVYLFPKALTVSSVEKGGVSCRGALGGTFIQHAELLSQEELEKLDDREFQKLLDRNSIFFYGSSFKKERGRES